jgi:transcriptional regulator with XRE-family HTH domain
MCMCSPIPAICNNTIGSIRTTLGILQEKYMGYYDLRMDLKKDIGQRIAKARRDRDWDQFELARRCGFFNKEGGPAQGRISHYETGRSPLSMELFQEIAVALGLTPDELWNYGNAVIAESSLVGAEAGLIDEFRLLDPDGKQEVMDEIKKIKRRMQRYSDTKPPLASTKNAIRILQKGS